jgi:hypothetical protein
MPGLGVAAPDARLRAVAYKHPGRSRPAIGQWLAAAEGGVAGAQNAAFSPGNSEIPCP